MSSELGTWLRQQRETRGWSRREMARQLIQAGRAAGDNSLPGIDSMCHNIRQWERGQRALTERYRLHHCKALGIPPAQFGSAPSGHSPRGPRTGCLPRPGAPRRAAWQPNRPYVFPPPRLTRQTLACQYPSPSLTVGCKSPV